MNRSAADLPTPCQSKLKPIHDSMLSGPGQLFLRSVTENHASNSEKQSNSLDDSTLNESALSEPAVDEVSDQEINNSAEQKASTSKKKTKQRVASKDKASDEVAEELPGVEEVESKQQLRLKKVELEGQEYVLEIFRLSEGRGVKKDVVCQVCEKGEDVVVCSGPCLGGFHAKCLGLESAVEGTFKCKDCLAGEMYSCMY